MNARPNSSWHAPLFHLLTDFHKSQPDSYHVPGHKYGKSLTEITGISDNVLRVLQSVMSIDVTELSLTDDLYAPSGVIEEAQRLAAATFGAEQSFFLVGGSTAGNLTMLLAVCQPDDLIIVQRNAHKSVLNGLKLSGARAVFLMPGRDDDSGLDRIPQLEQVEEALQRYPEAKAVLLTNPSYYGLSTPLEPYAELVHRYGKMLLVDEAHGAHYGLHPAFPHSAIQAGADVVVQSTHKTLQALTMGGMLHVQGDRIQREALMNALSMIQSSSPSYPIMASLDITRAMIDYIGPGMFERGLAAAAAFRTWVGTHSYYEIAASTDPHVKLDPLRISLCDRLGRVTGFELQKQLENYGIYAEMADSRYVVLLFGMAASIEEVERLQHALSEIGHAAIEARPILVKENGSKSALLTELHQGLPEPVTFSRAGAGIQNGRTIERIPLSEAAGRYASEAVIPYPPGIPLLYEGERISKEIIAAIKQLIADGARCQGSIDPTMHTIGVIKQG